MNGAALTRADALRLPLADESVDLVGHWYRGRPAPGYGTSRAPLPRSLRLIVIERDGYVCGLCGGDVDPDDLHIDHIKPVARGGRDELANLQVAHPTCNIRKGATWPEDA